MYCEKCGGNNSDTAVYCRKCGVQITEPEEETRVATRTTSSDITTSENSPIEVGDDTERQIFSIGPTLKFVKAGYVGAAIIALVVVGLTSAFFSSSVSVGGAVLLGLLLFLIPAFYHVKQKLVRYSLTESKLEIDTGLIARNTRNVPIRRIQDVTVSAGPWQRLLGIGDLMIDNASEDGGKTILKNIDAPKRYADELLEQMRRLEK